MSIYIPIKDYSAMQGPAPEGFHVPLTTEWEGLKTIMTSLSLTTGDSWRINLHMPFAGYRHSYNSGLSYQGSTGVYWSSSPRGSSYPSYASSLSLGSSNVDADYGNGVRAYGYSVRCFKNSFELPTSSWTVINGTLGSAGIFWDTVNGLISITGDGTTGYTIQDKNLGATTVYNNGDTLTQANMGNMYQWGNNYGFPSTGNVATSSTQVNAQNYGPGNYYSSSTFITRSTDWSYVHNDNLRGGETGPISMKEVQNIYIGEYVPPYEGPLRFTANTAGSYLALTKHNSPASVSLEISTDGKNWSPYTIGSYVNFSNIGDTVAFRNTSTTNTTFSTNETHYYNFYMSGSISADGDVSYLLNKNGTNTLSNNCFNYLFYQCSALTTPPQLSATTLGNFCYGGMFYLCTNLTTVPTLPATTLAYGCYNEMFNECSSLTTAPSLPATTLAGQCYMRMFTNCSNLETIPALPATTLTDYCYNNMFRDCSKIKLSTSQTGAYQTAYRIPTTGTGTVGTNSIANMFTNTGGTVTGTPSINTTYYTSNTVV